MAIKQVMPYTFGQIDQGFGFERVDRRDDDLLNDAFKEVEGWSGQKGLNHDPIRPYLDNIQRLLNFLPNSQSIVPLCSARLRRSWPPSVELGGAISRARSPMSNSDRHLLKLGRSRAGGNQGSRKRSMM